MRTGKYLIVLLFVALGTWGQPSHVRAGMPPTSAISLQADPALMQHSISRQAIDDVLKLLAQAFPYATVSQNNPQAPVLLLLPYAPPEAGTATKPSQFYDDKPYQPFFQLPDQHFMWRRVMSDSTRTVLILDAKTPQGVANGLYALLQERLGFKFFHPRQTLIPNYTHFPIIGWTTFGGKPGFDKRGFHLHTQHPLELTEQLHNPDFPNAIKDIKEYIDWLARNGQNVFQFYLLNNIKLPYWAQWSKEWVDYAHSRGIIVGLKMSLHSVQQEAFQLIEVKPKCWIPYKIQIDEMLADLFEAPWDYLSPDLSLAEFLPGMGKKSEALQDYLIQQLNDKYHAGFVYNTHVIDHQNMVTGLSGKGAADKAPGSTLQNKPTSKGKINTKKKPKANPHLPDIHDEITVKGKKVKPSLGPPAVLVHSVMCYALTDPKAPVYGNKNLDFMYQYARQQMKKREVWYFPESAYWITFDNSLPVLLLPYLTARLRDIDTLGKYGAAGHVTFSSGWEWGYWMIDWSIARWSWNYSLNDLPQGHYPTQYFDDLFSDPKLRGNFNKATAISNQYLINQELMRFIAAAQPTDELPKPYNKPFAPRPTWDSYKWLYEEAPMDTLDLVRAQNTVLLGAFAQQLGEAIKTIRTAAPVALAYEHDNIPLRTQLLNELMNGLEMTALRADHRKLTLRYLVNEAAKKYQPHAYSKDDQKALLQSAYDLRDKAAEIVKQQEALFRYPVDLLARPRKSVTSYQHGYLYSASKLHFWRREEIQCEELKFGVGVYNFWDLPRIIGLY